jgi:hypothetical protein
MENENGSPDGFVPIRPAECSEFWSGRRLVGYLWEQDGYYCYEIVGVEIGYRKEAIKAQLRVASYDHTIRQAKREKRCQEQGLRRQHQRALSR